MRVLYFSRDYTNHDYRFLEALGRFGHEVFFLRLENRGVAYEVRPLPGNVRLVDWEGGQVAAPDSGSWLKLMPSLESVIAETSPDLIHAGPVPSCGFMASLTGFRPLLSMAWGYDLLLDAERDPLTRWMARFALERSDGLIVDCAAVLAKAREITTRAPTKVVNLPWGLDLGHYSPGLHRHAMRERLGFTDELVVFSSRSWEPIYGINTLLKAFAGAYAKNARLRLLLLGTGSLAAEVDRLLSELAIRPVVITPGILQRAELVKWMDASDVYVSCALTDGSSISLLEAMAMHLPPIVTDLPANREWINGRKQGWLVPASDVGGYELAILDAVEETNVTHMALVHANRSIIDRRANWDNNFPRLLSFYENFNDKPVAA